MNKNLQDAQRYDHNANNNLFDIEISRPLSKGNICKIRFIYIRPLHWIEKLTINNYDIVILVPKKYIHKYSLICRFLNEKD
jgi:hypothetical protein